MQGNKIERTGEADLIPRSLRWLCLAFCEVKLGVQGFFRRLAGKMINDGLGVVELLEDNRSSKRGWSDYDLSVLVNCGSNYQVHMH